MKRCKVASIALLFFILINICMPSMVFSDTNSEKIRIGHIINHSFIEKNEDNSYGGYGVEYLEEISKYTNWQYEYIEDSWPQLLEKLDSGEIDLLCTAQYSPERAEKYEYAEYSTGIEYSGLYVPVSNTEIFYEDFKAFDGLKVGILKDTYQINEFEEYAKKNNFSYEPVYFDTIDELKRNLDDKKVQAVVASSDFKEEMGRLVTNISQSPFYFITKAGNNNIINTLNEGLTEIKVNNEDFHVKLNDKYYNNEKNLLFTKEEDKYIKDHSIMRVAYGATLKGSEYTLGEEKLTEISLKFLDSISSKSGIKFEYIRSNDITNLENMIANNEADLIASKINVDNKSSYENIKLTKSYLTIPLVMIEKPSKKEKNDNVTIGICDNSNISEEIFSQWFHEYNVKYYPTYDKCVNGLKNNEADMIMVDNCSANILQTKYGKEKIGILNNYKVNCDLSIGVTDNVDPVLMSILNKTILSLDDNLKTEIILNSGIPKENNSVIGAFLKEYLDEILMGLLVIIGVLLGLWIYNKRKRNKEYEKLTFVDPLTGRWNINKFKQVSKKILEDNKEDCYALIYSDIEKFKFINDGLGYEVGDTIIRALSDQLYMGMREKEFFARVSADNFVALLRFTSREELINRLSEIHNNFGIIEKTIANNYRMIVVAGIHIICPGEVYKVDIDDIMNKANMARKSIKGSHESKLAFYDEELENKISHEVEIESKMHGALIREEFKVYYQPKYDLESEEIIGAEALVRWQDPNGRIIPPSEFIPTFEKNGFIINLDTYVYRRVLMDMRERLDEGKRIVPVSINLSRLHVGNLNLIEDIKRLLDIYQIDPRLIEFELTESAFTKDIDLLIEKMHSLKENGFNISIDDFGSGFSSLNLLKEFQADTLKIDKTFLDETETSKRSRYIIRNIVNMAKEIDMNVICEGVETQKQADFLRDIGCKTAQGYLFTKPITKDEFIEMLDKN